MLEDSLDEADIKATTALSEVLGPDLKVAIQNTYLAIGPKPQKTDGLPK